MYICKDCEEVFEKPKKVVDEEYYGSRLYSYECPFCGGNFEEVVECKRCGKHYGESDLNEGLCPKCEKAIQEKVKAFFEQFTEAEIEYIFDSGILDEV